ncbi:MAG: potassium transporter [Muribaculaceae bacterium]|nr:potassium transporter [Muribaculaceae bacterium]
MLQSYTRLTRHSVAGIRLVLKVTGIASVAAAIMCLAAILLYIGYEHDDMSERHIMAVMRITQAVFAANVGLCLLLDFRHTVRTSLAIKWIVDIAVIISVVAWLYPRPADPWFPWIDRIAYSRLFLLTVLASYSVVTVCYAVIRTMGRHTNPSLILSGSFLFFIIIGSFLLMMPRCTVSGISYVDSLFVSTSAVCITGLTPVDVPSTFTPLGLIVLAVLIQIGALGVMTFTSFFALFFSGSTSVYSQLMIRDMIYTKSINSLLPTLLYILGFTIVIELAGMAALWWSIHGSLGMTTDEELAFAAFHSLSAFCNAGFSNIEGGLSNPLLLHGNQMVYVVTSILIIAGSIGFPILVNAKDAFADRMSGLWSRLRRRKCRARIVHPYNMNTRVVLVTWGSLFIAGTVLFLLLENSNSLAGMSPWEKIVQSIFNSVTPRSAGFSSVAPGGFLNVTIVMILFMMWVGGASQSTAGGVKVNTLAAICLNLRAIVLGREHVIAFNRTVSSGSIRRANAVVALSIFSYLLYSMALMCLEPELPARDLLFEACSALFTVGSSLGITDELSSNSKILLSTAMFIGRVGIISLLTGCAGNRRDMPARFPTDNIIIN